jgi:hypothetical protein
MTIELKPHATNPILHPTQNQPLPSNPVRPSQPIPKPQIPPVSNIRKLDILQLPPMTVNTPVQNPLSSQFIPPLVLPHVITSQHQS